MRIVAGHGQNLRGRVEFQRRDGSGQVQDRFRRFGAVSVQDRVTLIQIDHSGVGAHGDELAVRRGSDGRAGDTAVVHEGRGAFPCRDVPHVDAAGVADAVEVFRVAGKGHGGGGAIHFQGKEPFFALARENVDTTVAGGESHEFGVGGDAEWLEALLGDGLVPRDFDGFFRHQVEDVHVCMQLKEKTKKTLI